MTKPTSIFHQVQQVIADQLNADETLSAANVRFVPENTKDIDYEVTNALGKQGIVGLVMTPTANYIGNTAEGELAYDLRDLTIQIVENPPVNRGLSASITALDAAQKAQELLSAPLFTTFGIMNPVSIEQGEENNLIVAQAKFNCNIHATRQPEPRKYYLYWSIRNGRIGSVEDAKGKHYDNPQPGWYTFPVEARLYGDETAGGFELLRYCAVNGDDSQFVPQYGNEYAMVQIPAPDVDSAFIDARFNL